MKATDAMALAFRETGLRHFFAVSGGAAANLIDSLCSAGQMSVTFHNHEQAAALAADAYARIHGLGLVVVTTGPGVTNALTGTLCSWQDSVPTIVLSGQARRANCAEGFSVRQGGTQHLRVDELVNSIVKKVFVVENAATIGETVAEAVVTARAGRMGPVWIDFPLDQQLAVVSASASLGAKAAERRGSVTDSSFSAGAQQAIDCLKEAQAPLIVLGRGAAVSDQGALAAFLNEVRVPFVRTWGGIPAVRELKELDFGRVGVAGQRSANVIAGSADAVLGFGARFAQAVTGPSLSHFLREEARLMVVDCDAEELRLVDSLGSWLSMLGTVDDFLRQELPIEGDLGWANSEWIRFCRDSRALDEFDFPSGAPEGVDQYSLMRALDVLLGEAHILVVDGGGTGFYCAMQTFGIQSVTRVVIPTSSAPMGTGLPHAIGAAMADSEATIVVVCGDGSLPFNMQELAVIAGLGLPVKILVLDNAGYLSIRETQDEFLDRRHLGSDLEGGLFLTRVQAVAAAFGIQYAELDTESSLTSNLAELLEGGSPLICNVTIRHDQRVQPRLAFGTLSDGSKFTRPLREMWPPLPNSPLYQLTGVPPISPPRASP